MSVMVLALALLAPGGVSARPNVVLILTDDQRQDELGCTGHPVIQSPNIDALAATGVRFDRAFATSPVCAPSRATLVSGQWQRSNTVGFGRHRAFSRAQWDQSLFGVLRRSGYFTGLVGKSNIMGLRQDEIDYYCGSDDTAQGFYPHEHSKETRFLFGGAKARTQIEVFSEAVDDFLGVDHGFFERSDPRLRRYLGRRPPDQPFFLYVPFEVPHGTGTRTMELRPDDDPLYRTAYREQGVPLPVFPRNYLSWEQWRRPKLPANVYSGEQGPTYGWHFSKDGLREHQIRTAQTITGVDRFVGQLREKLKALGVLENTVFIFASDHGLMHGEWGYGGKVLLYEPSIRIPLIIHDPRLKGRGGVVSQDLVVMPDLAPTILDLCGLAIPAAMQGRSVAPLMRGEAVIWRTDFFAENLFVSQNYPVVHGVRGQRWKYLRYWPTQAVPSDYRLLLNLGLNGEQPVFEELYDLESDPGENQNLARHPAQAKRLESLRRRCIELQREALGRDPAAPLPSQPWENWRAEMKEFYDLFES